MAEYNTMEQAISGLPFGLKHDYKTFACQESAGINFGMPVFGYEGEENKGYLYYNDVGKLVFDADFVTGNVITITVNGVAAADVTFATDHLTTAGLVVAAVAALTGVECVLDTDDVNNRTFLIRTKGATATVSEAITGGATQATGTATYFSGQVFLGIARHAKNTAGLYEQYDPIAVETDGEIYVDVVLNPVKADETAYVCTTTGANKGAFTDSQNSVAISGEYRSDAAAGGLARVELAGAGRTKMTYASRF